MRRIFTFYSIYIKTETFEEQGEIAYKFTFYSIYIKTCV